MRVEALAEGTLMARFCGGRCGRTGADIDRVFRGWGRRRISVGISERYRGLDQFWVAKRLRPGQRISKRNRFWFI
ncbi:hypothetical protein CITRIK5_30391 [Citricoccus sp. K5]|nr:hypothetical protein CITRIK5_30391 [Citricoccus sp. K5]